MLGEMRKTMCARAYECVCVSVCVCVCVGVRRPAYTQHPACVSKFNFRRAFKRKRGWKRALSVRVERPYDKLYIHLTRCSVCVCVSM